MNRALHLNENLGAGTEMSRWGYASDRSPRLIVSGLRVRHGPTQQDVWLDAGESSSDWRAPLARYGRQSGKTLRFKHAWCITPKCKAVHLRARTVDVRLPNLGSGVAGPQRLLLMWTVLGLDGGGLLRGIRPDSRFALGSEGLASRLDMARGTRLLKCSGLPQCRDLVSCLRNPLTVTFE